MSAVLSINGVPYTDTFRFLRECEEVIERDVSCVVDKLIEFVADDALGDDEYELLPFAEPLRLPRSDWFTDETTLRRLNARWKAERVGYSSKRKEVK